MKNTSIEWADNTINFHIGCTKVSEGCKFCYMYRLEERFGRDPKVVRKTNWKTIESNLKNWKPSRIFVNSMSDTFHESISEQEINTMFRIMQFYPQHTYIILTKRIGRAVAYFKINKVPDNVWIGTSIESDKHLDRLDQLRMIEAKTRFVSFEPLLDYVLNFNLKGIQWIIVGGESGTNPRPMKPIWVDNIKIVSDSDKVPFFFKQWGGSKKCSCHNAWGCRVYEGKTWDELPLMEVVQ